MGNKKTKTNPKYSTKKSKSRSKSTSKETKSNKSKKRQQNGGRLISNEDYKTRFLKNIKIVKNPNDILDVPIKRPPRPECTIL
jgi:hypothetical protein